MKTYTYQLDNEEAEHLTVEAATREKAIEEIQAQHGPNLTIFWPNQDSEDAAV